MSDPLARALQPRRAARGDTEDLETNVAGFEVRPDTVRIVECIRRPAARL